MFRQTTTAKDFGVDFDSILSVVWPSRNEPLQTFTEMWYNIFLWALFSSLLVHFVAAGFAFFLLRKHNIGRFYAPVIIILGVLTPLTTGAVTSATVAFVYRTANFSMVRFHVALWGIGQTFFGSCFGFARILATL